MKKRPVIIDCDTGTDDAIALIAALYSPELDVKALTTVVGNVALRHTSRNTLNLVRGLGFDTKVAVGAPKPLMRDEIIYSGMKTHGDNGLGSLVLPETDQPFYKKTAVETIYEEALACGGKLELIPIGPLTNIALAIAVHPDLKEMIKQIVFMGGAKDGGNITTTSEFNIWADPEAAKLVFGFRHSLDHGRAGCDAQSRAECRGLSRDPGDGQQSSGDHRGYPGLYAQAARQGRRRCADARRADRGRVHQPDAGEPDQILRGLRGQRKVHLRPHHGRRDQAVPQ